MSRCRRTAWLLGLLLGCAWQSGNAVAALTVEVDGAVARPGPQVLAEDARLADAVAAAQPLADAYALGASWTQQAGQPEQLRLRAGLLFELARLRQQAAAAGDPAMLAAARRMAVQLQAAPVTGRRGGVALDLDVLEVQRAQNLPLRDGDRIHFPTRPTTITVIGAVVQACRLPQVALRDARDYLKDCPPSSAADPDWLYVIQPDGSVIRQGIALWNRSAPQGLAPGAVLYVPLSRRHYPQAMDDVFNDEAARFIATQPVDHPFTP